jgi:hypothetical protein
LIRANQKIAEAVAIHIACATHRVAAKIFLRCAEYLKSGKERRCHIHIAPLKSTVDDICGAGFTSASRAISMSAYYYIPVAVTVNIAGLADALAQAVGGFCSEDAKSNRAGYKRGQVQRRRPRCPSSVDHVRDTCVRPCSLLCIVCSDNDVINAITVNVSSAINRVAKIIIRACS